MLNDVQIQRLNVAFQLVEHIQAAHAMLSNLDFDVEWGALRDWQAQPAPDPAWPQLHPFRYAFDEQWGLA